MSSVTALSTCLTVLSTEKLFETPFELQLGQLGRGLTAEPTRVRLSPDGSVALVLSDRAKVAWVIR